MLGKIDDVRKDESPIIQTARDEIQRLRESAEAQVVNSQALIERLRSQLAQTDKADEIDAAVDEQMLRIKNANNEIDTLTETKYSLQAEYRKLEAEVGPIKYIAEFVYGEQADNTMLEEAVRWVILIIIFVFDPLAVLLLIASQYTFEWRNTRKDDNGERLRQYEQARAQRIVDNVPPNYDVPTPPEEEEVEEPKFEDVDQETLDKEFDDEFGDIEELQKEQPKKKEESSDVSKQRELELEEQEEDLDWKDAKQRWKDDHPQSTIKNYKNMYIRGVINKLPWETYLTKPDTIDNPSQEGYIQNEEQSNESIWKRIGDK